MILPGLTLTPALAAWLRAAHDDGQPELDIIDADEPRETALRSVTGEIVYACTRRESAISDAGDDAARASLVAGGLSPELWDRVGEETRIESTALDLAGEAHDRARAARSISIEVRRVDGSELSATEQTEVRALLAAHAVEPLEMPADEDEGLEWVDKR